MNRLWVYLSVLGLLVSGSSQDCFAQFPPSIPVSQDEKALIADRSSDEKSIDSKSDFKKEIAAEPDLESKDELTLPKIAVLGCLHNSKIGQVNSHPYLQNGDHRHLDHYTVDINPTESARPDYVADLTSPTDWNKMLAQEDFMEAFDRVHFEWAMDSVSSIVGYVGAYLMLKKGGILTLDGFSKGLGYKIYADWAALENQGNMLMLPTDSKFQAEDFSKTPWDFYFSKNWDDPSVASLKKLLGLYSSKSEITSIPSITPFGSYNYWPKEYMGQGWNRTYACDLDTVRGEKKQKLKGSLEAFFGQIGFGDLKLHFGDQLDINGRTEYWIEATKL